MAKPWFRLYSEFVSDPKIQLLAFEDQRHFVAILCLKCNETLDSQSVSDEFRERMIARALGLDISSAAEAKRRLIEVGLIDRHWQPVQWDSRQYQSDSSVSRTRKYREKRAANGLPRSWDESRFKTGLIQRDGGMSCVYCGSSDKICIDHMVPIAQGGTDDLDNLGFACKQCNSGKAGRTPEQAGYGFLSTSANAAYRRYCLSHHVTVTVTDKSRAEQRQSRAETDQTQSASEWESHRQWMLDEVRSIYPTNQYTDADWEMAARAMAGRLDKGVTTQAEVHRLTLQFAAQQDAKGNRDTQFVENPARHFDGRGKWKGPFPLPATKAQQRQDANVSASAEWLRGSNA